MKLGVICDGISRDLEHSLKVMDEFGLEYAELQFIWEHEIGDHDASQMAKIKGLLPTRKGDIVARQQRLNQFFCALQLTNNTVVTVLHI